MDPGGPPIRRLSWNIHDGPRLRIANMKLHEERTVSTSPETAFKYTADFSNIEQWDPGIESSRQIGDGPIGEGTKFDLDVKFGSSTGQATFEVTDYEPNQRVRLQGTADGWTAIDEIRFETADSETRIIYTSEITFNNFMKYLTPFMGPVFRRVGRRALDGLAGRLES